MDYKDRDNRGNLYRTLVENLQQCVFLKDTDLRFVSANSSFCKLIDRSLEQIVGKTDFDFFPENLAEKYQADDRRVIQSGDTLHLVEQNETPSGRRWVEVVKTPVRDAQGTISGILGIFWDITERVQIEESLRKNREVLEYTQKVAHIGSWTTDLQTKRLTWSDETFRIFGMDKAQFDGKLETFYSRIHPDDLDDVRRASENAIRTHDSYKIDHRILHSDGSVRWVHEQAELILGPEGKPMLLFGTVQDITERKEAEEAIGNLAKFPDENPNPVMRVSREGFLLFANNPCAPLLALWNVRVGQRLPLEWIELIGESFELRKMQQIEIECQKQRFLICIAPIGDKGYVNLYGVDITEQKRLEEQFRQAQKMEAIGQLAGGVAHDFNNLIMAILGYGQLIKKRLNPDDPMQQDLDEILKAGNRAASLTRQLLAFSRKQVLQPKLLELNRLIREMEKMLHRLIGEDVELELNLDPSLGIIKADPGQIEQIVMNLAVNARDAMPRGGRLTIETAGVNLDERYAEGRDGIQPGSYVMMSIRDTGCGMDKDTLNHLFNPFFTTKEVGKGTGLGLSTVYGIVKQSGAFIWVDSEPDKGTDFKIFFPQIDRAVVPESDSQTEKKPQTGTETILLVEDDRFVQDVIYRILGNNGYKVIVASDGEDAIRFCRENSEPVHLLIADVVMPKWGGVYVAQQIAEIRPGIHILYMSGYTDNEVIRHGLLDREINFIQKPFATDDLLHKIREILD